ncbi:hypothetical protein ACFVHB_10100 [Kitasatospora sp. NPDC127111]|uniref:hypothetical protein n=1 Tax=Kitasatospora sp. NPDC127111 TaxID=3345363 RepID=UPI00362B4E5C
MNGILVSSWALTGLQAAAVVATGRHLHRRSLGPVAGFSSAVRRSAAVLVLACVLPVPALIAAGAPAATWALWGAGYLAAALVYALADAARDGLGARKVEPEAQA